MATEREFELESSLHYTLRERILYHFGWTGYIRGAVVGMCIFFLIETSGLRELGIVFDSIWGYPVLVFLIAPVLGTILFLLLEKLENQRFYTKVHFLLFEDSIQVQLGNQRPMLLYYEQLHLAWQHPDYVLLRGPGLRKFYLFSRAFPSQADYERWRDRHLDTFC